MGDSAMRRHIITSMRDPISETPSPTRDEIKQRLRLRRFMLASIFSVLYLLVLVIFYTQDKVDRETLFEACSIVAAVIVGFFIVFRLGLNLRDGLRAADFFGRYGGEEFVQILPHTALAGAMLDAERLT